VPFTKYAKDQSAKVTYNFGRDFIAAGMLLHQNNRRSYPTLHLICQGTELVLKSLLLHKDYDVYVKLLAKRPINHNLAILAEKVMKEYNAKPMRPKVKQQLEAIDGLYSKHKLRYFAVEDSLGFYKGLEIGAFFSRLFAVVKLAERTIFCVTDEERERSKNELETFVYTV